MKSNSVLIALLLTICCATAQQQYLVNGYRINVGKEIHIQSRFNNPLVEPHLSVHPSNNDHLLVAAMVVTDVTRPYQSCRLTSFVSIDGGSTWSETAHDYWGYDPWTAISSDGQATMTWLGTKNSFQHQFPLVFFKSSDGGKTWSDKVTSISNQHGHDGTKLIEHNEHFYATTVRFNQAMGADVVLYEQKPDSEPKEVMIIDGNGTRLNFCEPAYTADDMILIPSSEFRRKVWVHRFDPASGELSDNVMITLKPGGSKGYMRLVSDYNATSPHKGNVYFVRALREGGIWINRSQDNGKSWKADQRVDLFEGEPNSSANLASPAINYNGRLAVAWIDSQHDDSGMKNDLYFTFSDDGGERFLPPLRISTTSSNPATSGNDDVANKFPGGGHYMNMAARPDGSFQLCWSDSRSGIFQLYTTNLSVSKQ